MENKLLIPVSIIIAGVIVGGAVLFGGSKSNNNVATDNEEEETIQPTERNPQAPGGVVDVSEKGGAVLGSADSPVTIIEFSDFQCPFCRSFWRDTLSQIQKEYIDTGKAKLVYRHFPLTQVHPSAMVAAQAAECARDQGKFWEMHDTIFEEQDKQGTGTIDFNANDLKAWAAKLGLNASSFNQCLDSGKYSQQVEDDLADGLAAGATGTPTFFVNGRLLIGAQPFSAFKAVINEELNK